MAANTKEKEIMINKELDGLSKNLRDLIKMEEQRSETMSDLKLQTEMLVKSSDEYKNTATKVKRHEFINYMKIYIVLILIIVAVVCGFIWKVVVNKG